MIAARRLAIGWGARTLLAELSFGVAGGECWAVVGRNGSGKTTLLRTLAGLMPPRGGEVRILERGLAQWKRPELARRLAFLPQHQPVAFPYTVEEFVGFGRVPWRGSGQDDGAWLATALATLQLDELRSRPLTGLSGGEAQRVHLAQLLAQATDALLLDEPLAHLDLPHQLLVMRALRRLAEGGRAVLLAMHDLALAWRYCDRLLVLGPGGARTIGRADGEAAAGTLEWAYEAPFRMGAEGPQLEMGGAAS